MTPLCSLKIIIITKHNLCRSSVYLHSVLSVKSLIMNPEIIAKILQSSGKFVDGQKDGKNIEEIIKNCPVLDSNALTALSTSITDLILHKVPRDMSQKNAVRYQIIEVFRGFIRPPAGLSMHPAFCDSEKLTEFAQTLVIDYLQKPADHYHDKHLSIFGRLLVDLALSKPTRFLRYVRGSLFIDKITDADPESTQDLVLLLLQYRDRLQLDFRTIERLYIYQQAMLIEDPLIDTFLVNADKRKIEDFVFNSSFNDIIRYAGQSPKIFQLTCSILKALFAELNYSPRVLSFNKFVMDCIASNRAGKNHILDLYPIHCMSCLTLMRIDPATHTFNTKNQVVQILRNIYSNKQPGVGILIIHMPIWLDTVLNIIEEYF